MNACDKNAIYSNRKKTIHSPFVWKYVIHKPK